MAGSSFFCSGFVYGKDGAGFYTSYGAFILSTKLNEAGKGFKSNRYLFGFSAGAAGSSLILSIWITFSTSDSRRLGLSLESRLYGTTNSDSATTSYFFSNSDFRSSFNFFRASLVSLSSKLSRR